MESYLTFLARYPKVNFLNNTRDVTFMKEMLRRHFLTELLRLAADNIHAKTFARNVEVLSPGLS